MTICKYFQQGCCRFGPNCKFEHVYGSQYRYQAPIQSHGGQGTSHAQNTVTDDQLVKQVQSDIQAMLQGNQWLLSSYAPFKEKAAVPGLPELSPDEARLFIYEAKANNTLDQAMAYMDNLIKLTRLKYDQLLHPKPAIMNVLRSIYNGEPVTSPFNDTQVNTFGNSSNHAASSIFRSAVQGTSSVFSQSNPQSIFSQSKSPSVFGQQNAGVTQQHSTFGNQNHTAKSIFAEASQNTFGSQNTFAVQSENATPKSLFAQANQNVFGQANVTTNPANVFANAMNNVFASQNQTFAQQQNTPFSNEAQIKDAFQNTNVFGGSKNVFVISSSSDDNSGIYSKMEDLAEEDLEQYKSAQFKLGFIPELPPPRSLCV